MLDNKTRLNLTNNDVGNAKYLFYWILNAFI